jgi:hypothetical protein
MSKNRYVNTRIWIDNYFSDLDPSEKLLFLHCLTNPHTNLCGCYEIPLRQIAMDTGLDKEMVIKILNRFTKDNKIAYIDGWIAIKNFLKHQKFNPSIVRAIEKEQSLIPLSVTKWLESIQAVNTLLTGCPQPKLSKSKNKDKNKSKNKDFVKPSLYELKEYITIKNYTFDPETFLAFYESNGWKVGRNPMKSWQSACVTWQSRIKGNNQYGSGLTKNQQAMKKIMEADLDKTTGF